MEITNFKTHETKNYEMFEFLDTNREPSQRIINNLLKSIKQIGVQIPIIVNEDKYIVDGQHRFWALRQLGYVVPYIVSKAWKNDQHTIAINNTSCKWTAMDFANYASENGNLDVQEAIKIAKGWRKDSKNRLSLISGLEILMKGRSRNGLLSKLKNMTYRIDCKSGAEVFDTLVVMNEHQMKASPFSQKITRSIKILHHDKGGLNNDAINLMCQKNYIQNYSKENDQLEYFIDIYNEALSKGTPGVKGYNNE